MRRRGRPCEKTVVGFIEALEKIVGDGARFTGQAGAAKEVFPCDTPTWCGDEEVIESSEALAVRDGQVPGLDFVAEVEQQRTLPGALVYMALFGNYQRQQALRDKVSRHILWQRSFVVGVQLSEGLQRPQAGWVVTAGLVKESQRVKKGR